MEDIKEAILDYIDTRDNTELVNILNKNRELLKKSDKTLFRGFTTLKDSLNVGDEIEQIDFITSWSSDERIAEYFAIYNIDLLEFDGIVLERLGVSRKEVKEKIVPIIMCCRDVISCIDFEDYTTEEDLEENDITTREYELITFKDTKFIVKEIYGHEIDNKQGYFVEVEQVWK